MRSLCAAAVLAAAALAAPADDKKKINPPVPAVPKGTAPKANPKAAALKPAPQAKKPDHPLYWYNVFPGLLSNKNLPAELNATAAQEQALKDAQKAWRDGFVKQVDSDKVVDFDAVNLAQYNGMLEHLGKSLDEKQVKRVKQITLQEHGMKLIDYPEIREALSLTDGDVTRMKKAHDQAFKELREKRAVMPQEEYFKRQADMYHGVTKAAREVLTAEQQQRLADWIGPQFAFK